MTFKYNPATGNPVKTSYDPETGVAVMTDSVTGELISSNVGGRPNTTPPVPENSSLGSSNVGKVMRVDPTDPGALGVPSASTKTVTDFGAWAKLHLENFIRALHGVYANDQRFVGIPSPPQANASDAHAAFEANK